MTATNGHLRNMTFNETFESSLVEKVNDKFTVDKSLIKGIKENDVSKIIDQNQVSGGVTGNQIFDQLREVSGVVFDTRKKFDKIKSSSIKSEKQIEALKSQKQILLNDEETYNNTIEKQKKELDDTARKLKEVTELMQSTVYRKDVYANLKDTVKHDLLVLKKRYFDKDVTLMRETTKLKSIRLEHETKMKLNKRCREMLESVQKSVNTKVLQRTTKIQSVCDVISKKQSNQQNRQIRQREIQQAMVSAMTDKLPEQKEWIKMLNANQFLKGILKSKMQALMNKYNQIEISFHKMKQATSLKDSNEFIERFLTRQETYGLLLESIADKQKKLEELKQQKDHLEKSYQSQLYRNQEISDDKRKNEPKSSKEQTSNPIHTLHDLNEIALSIARKKQGIYQWASKFVAAYQGNSNRDRIIAKYPKHMTKQLILEALSNIKKFMAELQAQQNHSAKIEEAFMKNNPKRQKTMTDEMLQKNARIKTLSTYDNENAEDIEDKDMAYDDLSQADYLQYNRRAIKKNDMQNRKFRIKTKPN